MSQFSKTWREPKKLTPETLLKQDVRRYLSITGWFCFPVLQGLGAYKGITDFIAVKNGQVIFVECKSPKGKQSPYQQEFERQIKESGGIYLLVKDVADLMSNKIIKEIKK